MSRPLPCDDDAPLPELADALLDDDALEALLRDLAALATIDEIIIKRGAGRVAEEESAAAVALTDVAALLRNRTVRGVQIRYRHDGERWLDTLMLAPPDSAARVRLVRIRHG